MALGTQDSLHKSKNDSTISLPRFDIHLGAGSINGARIGLRAHFTKHFSIETSFGIPATHFIGGGEREERYGIGINWHRSFQSGLMMSLLCAAKVWPDRSRMSSIPNNRLLNYVTVSLNIGYLSKIDSNFTFFIRGGVVGYEIIEDYIKVFKDRFGVLNFDLGIGWCFDFNK